MNMPPPMTLPATSCFSCRYSEAAALDFSESGRGFSGLICTRDGLAARKLCAYYEREPGADEPE